MLCRAAVPLKAVIWAVSLHLATSTETISMRTEPAETKTTVRDLFLRAEVTDAAGGFSFMRDNRA